MSKHLITQAQFKAVMGRNPSWFTAKRVGENTANFPVEEVSWYEAIVFCNSLSLAEGLSPAYEIKSMALGDWSGDPEFWGPVPSASNARWDAVRMVPGASGYRLPTEAQWEYACRASTTTPWNTGASITVSQANFRESDFERTSEVGSLPPNAWGLYDMHGNVSEWVWDWIGPYSSEAQTDPLGASSSSLRVGRGGGWDCSSVNLRSDFRDFFDPAACFNDLGFRVVRPI